MKILQRAYSLAQSQAPCTQDDIRTILENARRRIGTNYGGVEREDIRGVPTECQEYYNNLLSGNPTNNVTSQPQKGPRQTRPSILDRLSALLESFKQRAQPSPPSSFTATQQVPSIDGWLEQNREKIEWPAKIIILPVTVMFVLFLIKAVN